MDQVRVIEVKQSVFADNDRRAAQLRQELKERGVFLLNLMSSPGAGKTTTLKRTVELLKDEIKIGVMEADIDSDVDARTMAAAMGPEYRSSPYCQRMRFSSSWLQPFTTSRAVRGAVRAFSSTM